jgi:hypothetical protein
MARARGTLLENAGNSFRRSQNLGRFSDTAVIVEGSVGSSDKADFFKITLLNRSYASIMLSDLQSNLDVELYDRNRRLVGRLNQPSTRREYSSGDTPSGEYYLKVYPRGNGTSTYKLTILTATL